MNDQKGTTMDELVRVKLENGSEATLSRAFAEAKGVEILADKPAVDARGEALNEKPKVNLDPASPYAGMKPDELQTLADERQISVEGTGANGNVLKSDLLGALTAADAADPANAPT